MACRTSLVAVMVMVLLCIFLSCSVLRVDAATCTASGLASGLDNCLKTSEDKDDCCDYLINDIVYPCGITEICGLELGADVLEFFDYCRFKCHGLLPVGSSSS
jgi:hypothetical protein